MVEYNCPMVDTFGQCRLVRYTDPNETYHITLHFDGFSLEHLEIKDPDEAYGEYALIRRLVRHAAGQIELAEKAGVAFGKKHK